MPLVAALAWSPVASAVTLDWVTVGDPGNACESQPQGCFGAVAYEYQISRYEVTNAEYTVFLNAVAAADPNGVYSTGSVSIQRTGSPGSYSYAVTTGHPAGPADDQPVTSVSFYSALRFANWLHNDQPTGPQDDATTEDGAYTFSGPTSVGARNPDAAFALTSEDEWYKAAYYRALTSSYFDYPASTDEPTTCTMPGFQPNTANCEGSAGWFTNGGSYSNSSSPYGTFDQGGNAWEWNEAIVGSDRVVRGGSLAFETPASYLAAEARFSNGPANYSNAVGFRVVSLPVTILPVTIDWTPVGNPGNACDTQSQGCFGSVADGYNIGTYEVTNAQYAEFLNAVAATDTNTLYNTSMGSGFGGIARSGSSGSYAYSAIAGRGDLPVNFVSFYDSLRFANWLHNGQPTGAQDSTTTEDGAYMFSGPTTVGARNAGAAIFLTSEDEWYKAAYYDAAAASYFDYPAGSDTQTTCASPTAAPNHANCDFAAGDLTDVGDYTGSASLYGTFDQGGNILEWTEAIIGANRGLRGGGFGSSAIALAASIRGGGSPST